MPLDIHRVPALPAIALTVSLTLLLTGCDPAREPPPTRVAGGADAMPMHSVDGRRIDPEVGGVGAMAEIRATAGSTATGVVVFRQDATQLWIRGEIDGLIH